MASVSKRAAGGAAVEERPTGPETRIEIAIALCFLIVLGFLSIVALISGGLGITLRWPVGALVNGYVDLVGLARAHLQAPLDAAADGMNWLLAWNVHVQPLWLHIFIGVIGVLAQPLLFIELRSDQRERRRANIWSLLLWALALAMVAAWVHSAATMFILILIYAGAHMFAVIRSTRSEQMLFATTFILPVAAFVAVLLSQMR